MKLPDLSIDPAAGRRRARIRATGAIVVLAVLVVLAAIAPRLLRITGSTTDRWNHPAVPVRSAADPIAPVDLGTRHAAPPLGPAAGAAQSAVLQPPPPVRPESHGPRQSAGTETGPATKPDGAGHAAGPASASRRRRGSPSAPARRIGAQIGARIAARQRHGDRRRHARPRHRSMPDPLADVAIDARVFGARGR